MDYCSLYLTKLMKTLQDLDRGSVNEAISQIETAWRSGRQIIVCGNGGSAITSLHFITDWNKSIYLKTGIPFRGRTLVDNVGLLTAYANDISYGDIFLEQLKNVASEGDVLLAISGSGNSENILRAVKYARSIGVHTIGLCGFDGGKLIQMVDTSVWAEIMDMQVAEDIHAIFGHILMQALCGYLEKH